MLIRGIVTNGQKNTEDNTIEVTIPEIFGEKKLRAVICNTGYTVTSYEQGTGVILGFLVHDAGQPVVLGTCNVDDLAGKVAIQSESVSVVDKTGNSVDLLNNQKANEKKIDEINKQKEEENQIMADKENIDGGGELSTTTEELDLRKEKWFRRMMTYVAYGEVGYYEKGEELSGNNLDKLYDNEKYKGFNNYTKYHRDLNTVGYFGRNGNWCGGPDYPWCLYFVMWCLATVAVYYLLNKRTIVNDNYENISTDSLRELIRNNYEIFDEDKKTVIKTFVYNLCGTDKLFTTNWLDSLLSENVEGVIQHQNLNIRQCGIQVGDLNIRRGHVKIICLSEDNYISNSFPQEINYSNTQATKVFSIEGNSQKNNVQFFSVGNTFYVGEKEYYVAKLMWKKAIDYISQYDWQPQEQQN